MTSSPRSPRALALRLCGDVVVGFTVGLLPVGRLRGGPRLAFIAVPTAVVSAAVSFALQAGPLTKGGSEGESGWMPWVAHPPVTSMSSPTATSTDSSTGTGTDSGFGTDTGTGTGTGTGTAAPTGSTPGPGSGSTPSTRTRTRTGSTPVRRLARAAIPVATGLAVAGVQVVTLALDSRAESFLSRHGCHHPRITIALFSGLACAGMTVLEHVADRDE